MFLKKAKITLTVVKDCSKKISLLEWDRNIFFIGAGAHIDFGKLVIQVGFDYGLSDSCGKMADSDWLNISNYEMKTTYSIGDSEALKNYQTELGACALPKEN